MDKITLRFMFLILETLRYILGLIVLQTERFQIEKDGIREELKNIATFHNSITGFNSLFTRQTLRFLDDDQLVANILFTNDTLDLINENPDIIDWWISLSPRQRFELIIDIHQAITPPDNKQAGHQPA